jgi:AAA domain, putative AbiEii toxin, Type IV TA system
MGDISDDELGDLADTLTYLGRHPRARRNEVPELLSELTFNYLDGTLAYYAQNVRREIERVMGARIVEVQYRNGTSRHLKLVVAHGDPKWEVSVEITSEPQAGRERLRVRYGHQPPRDHVSLLRRAAVDFVEMLDEDPDYALELEPADHLAMALGRARWHLFGGFPRSAYYLPAARSGIMQSQRAIASAVISQASLAGIQRMEVPQMSGATTDFLADLVSVDTDDVADMADVAEYLEQRIMRGRVLYREDRSTGGRDMVYVDDHGREFRLHRTSSMISELAPLVVYLRHYVDRGEQLVIEEPESSLHPETQLKLAEALVRCVRKGAQIILTTHSDYFLSALNQSIQAAALMGDHKLDNLPLPPLDADQVGAYLLRPSNSGTKVIELPVSGRHGIPEEEFARVAEELYEAAVELDEKLSAARRGNAECRYLLGGGAYAFRARSTPRTTVAGKSFVTA